MNIFLISGGSGITVDFSATPSSGTPPLTVHFTDTSSNAPTGWAWFFGDEDYTEAWTQQTAGAGWSARGYFSSVVMPDGSIVLMGGDENGYYKNDTWRSTDNGATWSLVNASSGWTGRYSHSSVVMPDGSIVLMGGHDTQHALINDTWRSTDNGATWSLVNASSGWTGREGHSSVAMPDGSIVLMGGWENTLTGVKNDTWRSTDNGATWSLVNANAEWIARSYHSSVVIPDGSIVLTGGLNGDGSSYISKNDTWRSTDKGDSWTRMNATASWTARSYHNSVVMPDGSIVLMGGSPINNLKNDMWRSTDNGATWSLVNTSTEWSTRECHTSVVIPDGSIVLMGGWDYVHQYFTNDVWRLMPAGSSVQDPSHTYTTLGIYPVALQAYNAGGYNSTRKTGYISVTAPSSPSTTYTVCSSGGCNFTSIQSAIDNSTSGDTIEVYSGVYSEDLLVTKSILIRGFDTGGGKPIINTTSLNQGNSGDFFDSGVVRLKTNNITFDGFEIKNPNLYYKSCILISSSSNVIVKNNSVSSGEPFGVFIFNANNNIIDNNVVNVSDHIGINSYHSSFNTIRNNAINQSRTYGLYFDNSYNNTAFNNIITGTGVHNLLVEKSNNNTISNNTIIRSYSNIHKSVGSWQTLYLIQQSQRNLIENNSVSDGDVCLETSSDSNIINNNRITGSSYGVYITTSNNKIFNNYISSSTSGYDSGSNNYWNITKQSVTNIFGGSNIGGNLWLSPSGTGFSETHQDSDNDGICDDFLQINNGIDYLPLCGHSRTANFSYSPSNPEINSPVTFDATNSTSDGSIIQYNWIFGDGNTTVTATDTTTYTYVTSGNYNVILEITDNFGLSNMTAREINVVGKATNTSFNVTGIETNAGIVTVNTSLTSAAGAVVTLSNGDTVITMTNLDQNGWESIVFTTDGVTHPTPNIMSGHITGIIATTNPITTDLGGDVGEVEMSVTLNLDTMPPANASVNQEVIKGVTQDLRMAFQNVATNGHLTLKEIAYILKLLKDNFIYSNPATINMAVNADWVINQTGVNPATVADKGIWLAAHKSEIEQKIKIFRNADDGSTEVLNAQYVSYTAPKAYFQAYSPNGMSTFGFGSVEVVSTPPSPPAGSGTSYSSGSGYLDSDSSFSSNVQAPGSPVIEMVNVGGESAVTRAEVTGTNLGKNLVVTAMPRNSLPMNMDPPPTTVYQYLSITTGTIPGVVNQATLDFTVPLSWINEHGYTVGDIVMMHNVDGQWQTLETVLVSQKGGNAFYCATTPGFSYFAIAYQKGGTDMGTGTPVSTTVAMAGASVTDAPSATITPAVTQTVPPAPITPHSEGIPLTTIIVGVMGAIAIVIGAFYVRRWWIRRQNPALFREYD